MNTLISFIACLTGVLAILIIGEALHARKILYSENYRKFIHMASGCFIATWPWLLSWQAIQLLGVAMAAIIIINRPSDALKIYSRVSRSTYGDIFFALAVIACAFITDNKIFFAVAILELSLADGIAALVGQKYGQGWQYRIFGQTKSVIGSMSFWLASMLILAIGLIFAHNQISFGHYEWLVLGLPPLLTAVENLGVFGLDNILVPLVVVAALGVSTG